MGFVEDIATDKEIEKSIKNHPIVIQTIATMDKGIDELATQLLSRFSTNDKQHNP